MERLHIGREIANFAGNAFKTVKRVTADTNHSLALQGDTLSARAMVQGTPLGELLSRGDAVVK